MTAFTYDNTDIILMVAGIELAAFGENKVTLTRNNDVTTIIEGLDSNMFASSSRKAGTLSFELLYGTAYDLFMDNLSGTKSLVPVNFIHKNSFKTLNTVGMVMTQPDISLGDEPESREWVLVIDNASLDAAGQIGELIANASYFTAT